MKNLHLLKSSNFEDGLKNPRSLDLERDYSQVEMESQAIENRKSVIHKRKKGNQTRETEDIDFLDLMYELKQVFSDHFDLIFKGQAPFPASVLFGDAHLNKIIDRIESISSEEDLSNLIGGNSILGVNKHLYKTVADWKSDSRGELHYKRINEAKNLSDLNNRLTLERLENNEKERKKKEETEALERKEQAIIKEQRDREKDDEKKRKKEEIQTKKKKREEERRVKELVRNQNVRMIQWLKEGVHESHLNEKEIDYQR